MKISRRIDGDWYDGVIPSNVSLGDQAYIETSFCFSEMRSQCEPAITFGRGASSYSQSIFDLGKEAQLHIGEMTMINNAHVICDRYVSIGNHTLISWNVVIMDNYRYPFSAHERQLRLVAANGCLQTLHAGDSQLAKPVHIGNNVWIGFDCCILPGVTIGDGAVVGARSVVFEDVPSYTVVAGNPAKRIRALQQSTTLEDADESSN